MNTNTNYHFLSLNQHTIRTNGLEHLVSMWSVISKCKEHLEEGSRLENMSWRLWHQKHQQQFVQPTLSVSAGTPHHEVSQAKQTQNNHVPDTDGWPFSLITAPSSPTTKAETAGSTKALAPPSTTTITTTTTTTTITPTTSSSRTTTPSLSNSYQYRNEQYDDDDDDDDDALYDEDYDDDFLDDDDLYDENDNYIDDEELFMHHHHRAEKLRPYRSSEHYFEKTRPQPLTQQPSLLSALFKTSSSSPPCSLSSSRSSSSRSSSSDAMTPPPASTFRHTFTTVPNAPPPDHFLKKEWTESLRDNVLWEHVQQQKPLYPTRSHPSYYHHPPPSSAYQSPYRPTNSYNHHRPPLKKTNGAPSDQGWLESFHGW